MPRVPGGVHRPLGPVGLGSVWRGHVDDADRSAEGTHRPGGGPHLRPGGRYGIHELCLQPDDLGDDRKSDISAALSEAIHVGARPLTPQEWTDLLEGQRVTVQAQFTTPMHLLEPRRLLKDEGIGRTIGFFLRVARNLVARQRIKRMRSAFRTYEDNMAAIALVATRN